jgi:hypothetical protein
MLMPKYLFLVSLGFCISIQAAAQTSLRVEGGTLESKKNEIQIPNGSGTQINLSDKSGSYYRIEIENRNKQHQWRLLYAPLNIKYKYMADGTVTFKGATFAAGEKTVEYKFNSYRLGYAHIWEDSKLQPRLGVTGKVRDAFIEVRDSSQKARKSDLGFVPLLHAGLEYFISPKFSTDLEIEGLGSKQGRAIDARFEVRAHPGEKIDLSIGYRVLDGGADNKKVETFALFQYTYAAIKLKF